MYNNRRDRQGQNTGTKVDVSLVFLFHHDRAASGRIDIYYKLLRCNKFSLFDK